MAVEVWAEDQEWPIELPAEPPRSRVLQARDESGDVVHRWRYFEAWDTWRLEGRTWGNGWVEIVRSAMLNGWTLHSLPPGADS